MKAQLVKNSMEAWIAGGPMYEWGFIHTPNGNRVKAYRLTSKPETQEEWLDIYKNIIMFNNVKLDGKSVVECLADCHFALGPESYLLKEYIEPVHVDTGKIIIEVEKFYKAAAGQI